MGYIEKNPVPGETVLYKTRLHWIVLVWPLFAEVLLGGIGIALLSEDTKRTARAMHIRH